MRICEQIKNYRKTAGLTQEQVVYIPGPQIRVSAKIDQVFRLN